MKIIVDHIHEKPLTLHAEEPVESFPVLAEMQSDGECNFKGPVCCDVSAIREYDHIRVTGRVSTPVSLSCSRCLENFESAVDSSFTIFFRKGAPLENVTEEEIELNEQDLISSIYNGDEIDLTHDLEEQIVMGMPIKPLCNENCKGLCPVCGIDLNKGGCSCADNQINFKFSALKGFKVSK